MAGLAAVTTRIQLFATVAVLTMPPAIVARMAVTIDCISHGRFGVNIVSGWQKAEYDPDGHLAGRRALSSDRYEYCAEYVTVMRELWATGASRPQGPLLQDGRLPAAARSRRRTIDDHLRRRRATTASRFAAQYADYNFCAAAGINDADSVRAEVARLAAATAETGRDCGALVLTMIIADETDAAAMAKWEHYVAGTDLEALAWRDAQAGARHEGRGDIRPPAAWSRSDRRADQHARLIGSYATVARLLDEMAEIAGCRA